jgi:hypothetical protein
MALVNLSTSNVNKIQIDEGIVVVNHGETGEMVLGPTRGGAEFTATPSIRDIEFDGRKGKTKGMQVKDGEDVSLKISTLCCSLDYLKLAIPGATVNSSTNTLTPGKFGVIDSDKYLKNVAVVTKMLDGTYTIITVKNPMHEGAFTYKGVSKNENEHSLEFLGHYDATDSTEECCWNIETSATNPLA